MPMQPRSRPLVLASFSVCLAFIPLSSWAHGVGGGGGSRGGGVGGAAAGNGAAAAGGTSVSAGASAGKGPGGPGRSGSTGGYGGGVGRGYGFGRAYGRPGTFTGYGDPYGEHRPYAASRAIGGTVFSGDGVRVVDLQRALKARGYYHGSANGRFDRRSIEALERFRRDKKIAPADFLDRPTVDALQLPLAQS